MVRRALLLAVVAGCVFAQQTPQTTAPPMSNGAAVLVSLFKPVYPLLPRQAHFRGSLSGSYSSSRCDKSHVTQLTRSEAKNKTSMLKETWDERPIFGKK
jgi:hypothetical protein